MTSKAYLEKLFAAQIDGHRLLVNNSRWGNFRTRRTRQWYVTGQRPGQRPVALLGDAAHTAHFSVGSGTKMAMEDAVALSAALAKHGDDLPAALAAYEAAARPPVAAVQDAARPSLGWWEHFEQYYDAFAGGEALALYAVPPGTGRRAWGARAWGARIAAPDDDSGVAEAHEALAVAAAADPVLVAVHGGTPYTRSLLTERARLYHKRPALLVDDGMDHDQAVTAVLSGRADLVGVRAATVASWTVPAQDAVHRRRSGGV